MGPNNPTYSARRDRAACPHATGGGLLTRTVRADALSDAVVKDARTITATGRLIGTYRLVSGVVLCIQLAPDDGVDVHPA